MNFESRAFSLADICSLRLVLLYMKPWCQNRKLFSVQCSFTNFRVCPISWQFPPIQRVKASLARLPQQYSSIAAYSVKGCTSRTVKLALWIWVLSHWAHFTVHRFICVHLCLYFVCFCFILHSCCIIVSTVG